MNAPDRTRPLRPRSQRGFSLIELMVTLLIFSFLASAIITVLVVSTKQKSATTNELDSTEMGRTALDMVSRDLRSAGFGVDHNNSTPQPPIAYVDSVQILINSNQFPYPDTSITQRGEPLAYDPNGWPRPKPLNGTSWTPPKRYVTGAETIRWTLDLNNDGIVDATDFTAADAADAQRTKNPDDYELCREVYGDSTGGVVGNNGGTRERIALVKRPGGNQPPLFRVYMEGDDTPWDWSNGPVPASRLQEIVRIEINVVATSPNRNFLGQYSDTRLTTTVNEIRNSPNFSFLTYLVSGVVFNDVNKNKKLDGGELGVSGANITLGGYLSQITSSTGSFSFKVPPGTYALKQDPPSNYGIITQPDSFIVTVGPSKVCNFADTARAGGWLYVTVFNDVDKNASYGGSDKPMLDLAVTLVGPDESYLTDVNGKVQIFVPVGSYKVSSALPDSFTFSTTHPVTGTMTNGGSQNKLIGMYIYDSGVVSGTVFNDEDSDGVLDGGEKGVPQANVSCTLPDSTMIYTLTDGNGKYDLRLPVNDPPKTTPYTIVCVPPSGYAVTDDMEITGVFLQKNQALTGKNFALGKFSIWKFDASPPVSALVRADFIEKDWTGVQTKHARQDLDIITGSDGPTKWSLEEWFNQYDRSPIFLGAPNVERVPSYNVYAMAADTIDAAAGGFSRPDIIVGQRYRASGNWSIWMTQDGTGNEGFLPNLQSRSYLTSDNGDVTGVATVPPTVAGNPTDIIVGTRSPAGGEGVIEVWKATSRANPVYTRSQTITNVPGGHLGEVTGMVMANMNTSVAGNELVVTTQTGFYSGQVVVLKDVSGTWSVDWSVTLATEAPLCVTAADVSDDAKPDLVVGTQTSHSAGKLYYYKNKGGNPVTFDVPVIKTGPGIVTAVNKADYGTDGIEDIIVGWRDTDLTFGGGLQIWYTNTKTLPASGVDPTTGQIKNWVSGLVVGDFNYGVWPVAPSTTQVDIAGSARKDKDHGQVFTLLR